MNAYPWFHKVLVTTLLIATSSSLVHAQSETRTEQIRITTDPITGKKDTVRTLVYDKTEDIRERKHMIVVNPLKFFLFYNLSYFQKLTPTSALGIGLQTPTISDYKGIGVNAEYRFYPSGKSLRGFYLAPNFSYNSMTYTYSYVTPDGEKERFGTTSFGMLLGWQWFPGDDFAMGLGIGADYYVGSGSNSSSYVLKYDGVAPSLRFDIGFAW